jgi:hypothetical protein
MRSVLIVCLGVCAGIVVSGCAPAPEVSLTVKHLEGNRITWRIVNNRPYPIWVPVAYEYDWKRQELPYQIRRWDCVYILNGIPRVLADKEKGVWDGPRTSAFMVSIDPGKARSGTAVIRLPYRDPAVCGFEKNMSGWSNIWTNERWDGHIRECIVCVEYWTAKPHVRGYQTMPVDEDIQVQQLPHGADRRIAEADEILDNSNYSPFGDSPNPLPDLFRRILVSDVIKITDVRGGGEASSQPSPDAPTTTAPVEVTPEE